MDLSPTLLKLIYISTLKGLIIRTSIAPTIYPCFTPGIDWHMYHQILHKFSCRLAVVQKQTCGRCRLSCRTHVCQHASTKYLRRAAASLLMNNGQASWTRRQSLSSPESSYRCALPCYRRVRHVAVSLCISPWTTTSQWATFEFIICLINYRFAWFPVVSVAECKYTHLHQGIQVVWTAYRIF